MSNTLKNSIEQRKIFNSSAYVKKIKKMVEAAKNLRGVHGKIPKGEASPLKETASAREKAEHARKQTYRLNINVLHYFAAPITNTAGARRTAEASPTPNTEA